MSALPSRLVRLGFRCDPFPLLPRPELYYPEPEREQELKVLHHLLTYTHLLPVVEGPAGIGKTTFLHRLEDTAPRHWRSVFLTAPPDGMDEAALLAALSEGFEAPRDSDDPLFTLQEHLERLTEHGDLPVALIDDAHYLAPEALRLLTVLAVGDEQLPARLHAALAAERLAPAQIEAVRSLTPEDAPDPLKSIRLLPFDRQQTHDYLAHRIRACGGRPEVLLDADTVARLHQAAQGLPGQLDTLARAWLHDEALPAAPPPRRRLPVWPLLLAPIVAILLWPKDETPTPPTPEETTPQVTRALPLPALDEPPPATRRTPAAERNALATDERPATPSSPTTETPTAESAREPEPAPTAGPESPMADGPPRTAPKPRPVHNPPPADETPARPTESKVPAEPRERATSAPAPAPAAPEPAAKPADAAPRAAPPAASAPGDGGADLRDEAWLLAQPPGRYTLQVLSSPRREAVLERARRLRLAAPVAVFRFRHQGRDWYALVVGAYPDRASARRAIDALPPDLRNNRPWVRRLGDVQALIRAAR